MVVIDLISIVHTSCLLSVPLSMALVCFPTLKLRQRRSFDVSKTFDVTRLSSNFDVP